MEKNSKSKIEIAEEIYLNSVCVENNFAPMTFGELVDILKEQGIETSTSSVHRWSVERGWKEKARNIAGNLATTKVAKNIASKSSIETLKNIEKTTALSAELLLEYVDTISQKTQKSVKEVDLVLKIMVACAALITKPLEKPQDDKIDALQLLENARNISESDIIDIEAYDETKGD